MVQSVFQHCWNTAKYAKRNLEGIGLGSIAYIAGIFHDIGKQTEAFKKYIEDAYDGNGKAVRGSVNHTFAGVGYVCKENSGKLQNCESILREIIAVAMGSHHGLFDCVDASGRIGLLYRCHKQGVEYEGPTGFADELLRDSRCDIDWQAAMQEFDNFMKKVKFLLDTRQGADVKDAISRFYCGLLVRLIMSAVIDGDRLDTAIFMENSTYLAPVVDKKWWCEKQDVFEANIRRFGKSDILINRARQYISDECFCAGNKPTGIYRLNVPTGGGKTLGSLRFALNHAVKRGKSRIIYVLPLLSIIEQNAAIIKEFLTNSENGKPTYDFVLEHHSNVVNENRSEAVHSEDSEDIVKFDKRLLLDNWQSPVVITTLVQFLNTLFSHKTVSVRRMSALCGSIIVFDEVQSVPNNMLSLFNLACNFLKSVCNATILLCSATQPSFERAERPLCGVVENLFELPAEYQVAFKRVNLLDKGDMNLDELSDFVSEQLVKLDSVLVVCNTKKEAKEIYQQVRQENRDDVMVVHLSADMCMAHRKNVLKNMQAALAGTVCQKVVCISTQVIEAGVDVSFACVIRLKAGLDNIVQAVGRCNRHGECVVAANAYIVDYKDEDLSRLKEIQSAKTAMNELLHPQQRFDDLLSDAAVDFYYRKLYENMQEHYQDFYIKKCRSTIFDMLAANHKFYDNCQAEEWEKVFLHQAFRTAGESFRVFDDNTVEVLVPYGSGRDIISGLCSERAKYDMVYAKKLIKKAGNYIISVYENNKVRLQEAGALTLLEDFDVYFLGAEFYDDEGVGLLMEPVS